MNGTKAHPIGGGTAEGSKKRRARKWLEVESVAEQEPERVGLGVETGGGLQNLLAARNETLRQSADNPPLPLMPGLPGSKLLTEWGILTP